MDFTFTEDQLLFRDSVRDFLVNEVNPDSIRARWETDSGRSVELWSAVAELGLTGMLVPEAQGGLGMNEVDFVLLAEECGRAALPEPLVDTVLIASPLLAALSLADKNNNELVTLLQKIAAGEAVLAVQQQEDSLVSDAEFASHLLMQHGDGIYLVGSNAAKLLRQQSVDPSRLLYSVEWNPEKATLLVDGDACKAYQASVFNRGALASAAQLLGLAQRITAMSVAYSSERQQFGKPIGSFQAMKHHLANVAVKSEFAKAPVYRAAYSVAQALADADLHVSHAKLAASEAALLAAKSGIQVHGAMGYTWEVDLHIFMKRAWALDSAWGTRAQHKARVASAIFAAGRMLGAGNTFASATEAAANAA